MKHAETVTLGGSGLNRAAELRGSDAQEHLRADPAARITVFWRGKPLVERQADGAERLVWLPFGHDVFVDAEESYLFLGKDEEGAPLFLADISAWQPTDPIDQVGGFLDTSEQTHEVLGPTPRFVDLKMLLTRLSPRDGELAATGRGILEWHRSHQFCANCGGKSQIAMAGWQRDCAACGRKHFPRTDPVVIMLITHGNSVLLGRSPGWPEGMYSLLAGFIEPGETLEGAVRREVWEEAGVTVGTVGYLASQPWPFPGSLMLGCYGQATSADIQIDPIEIEDAIWVPREEMMDVFEGVHQKLNPMRKGAIAHFLVENWLADTLG